MTDNLPRTVKQFRHWWDNNTDVPYGYCWCGCGVKTSLCSDTFVARLYIKDAPRRFIKGHNTPKQKFPNHVAKDYGYDTPCWEWLGTVTKSSSKSSGVNGVYGVITIDGKFTMAHRKYYEEYVGSIPENLTIDHLCGMTLCMNPEHMEAVTQSENTSRSKGKLVSERRVRLLKDAWRTGEFTEAQLADRFRLRLSFVELLLH